MAIKLIRHNAGGVKELDDPSLPFKLEADFRPPDFMTVAFAGLYGNRERIEVRGDTPEELEEFAIKNRLHEHVRLVEMHVMCPESTEPDSPIRSWRRCR